MRQKKTEPLPGDHEGRDGSPSRPPEDDARSPSRPLLSDWEVRLNAFAQRVLGLPFLLGSTNCSMLAAKAIDAMYDTTFAFKFSTVATTDESELSEASDRRTLREFEAHGFSRVAPNFEQPGDILIGWKEPFERCAVYLGGNRVLSCTRERGVIIFRKDVFVRAYNAGGFRWL